MAEYIEREHAEWAQKGAKASVFNGKANGGKADDNAENELKERAKDNDRN